MMPAKVEPRAPRDGEVWRPRVESFGVYVETKPQRRRCPVLGEWLVSRTRRVRRALCLGQVTPRKSCSCDLCEGPIPRGALAWKGLTEDPPLPVRAAPGADAFRVCSGCVERLTVPEAQPAQAWPVRGLEC
jgi:hypothetical protein